VEGGGGFSFDHITRVNGKNEYRRKNLIIR
jgi:hypothetical protein